MFGEHPIDDTVRVLRAWTTNQIAWLAPRTYVNITRQTGRGESEGETPEGIADYFFRCFNEYFEVRGCDEVQRAESLRGKILLEYGPGDVPGVALLMVAYGAEKVFCVDRFPLLSLSPKNADVIEVLIERLPPDVRPRAKSCFDDAKRQPSKLNPNRIEYLVRPSGLSGLRGEVDFAFSRAVLEHVDDLPATFADTEMALRDGGTAIHLVDLKSHGLHRSNPLDFLTWPQWLWRIMYSYKGVPNRWRVNYYRDILRESGLTVQHLASTSLAEAADVAEVRPHLAQPFRNLTDDDLACLGFWLVCKK